MDDKTFEFFSAKPDLNIGLNQAIRLRIVGSDNLFYVFLNGAEVMHVFEAEDPVLNIVVNLTLVPGVNVMDFLGLNNEAGSNHHFEGAIEIYNPGTGAVISSHPWKAGPQPMYCGVVFHERRRLIKATS